MGVWGCWSLQRAQLYGHVCCSLYTVLMFLWPSCNSLTWKPPGVCDPRDSTINRTVFCLVGELSLGFTSAKLDRNLSMVIGYRTYGSPKDKNREQYNEESVGGLG